MYPQNEINNDIKFLAKSEIRLKILNELNICPDNVRGIVKRTKLAYSTVSSNINKLEEKKYIGKVKKRYHLNPMAKIYFNTLMEFKRSVEIINNFNAFWYMHNLNQLSMDSMQNITDLKDSKLIETTPLDIYKTHNTIKKQLVESKEVKAIFPYLHPEYPELIENVLKNGGTIELIVPKNILKAMMAPVNEQLKKDAIKNGKLKLHSVTDEIYLYLTVCDEKMSLGLFKNDDSFDQNRILISDDKKSYEWAEELFNHVKHEVIQ